ncbi:MAG: tRNA (N6-isopentenyl adenosine(37)-C2)-methylthiotransferase MiaB [Myxococcales bacterium]|nr:tRNA (N6-isopentenyl adenosine(37)-C2)-methylthiotransferase MiaB [Myxococcales bacterium]
MKRALIQTFGCQMNVHDSRRIEEVLAGSGYVLTDRAQEADLVVFNTCSVREKADHKLYSAVGTLRETKARRSEMVIAVAGCLAQQQGERLLDRLDLVDIVIGPDNVAELPALVRAVEGGGPPLARTEFDLDAPAFLTARPRADGREVTAYVTVMKGCDEGCTYCIVPYTRGRERYRPADEIVAEIATLVAGGVREVTLLGQTVNSWHDPSTQEGLGLRTEGATELSSPGESRFVELLHRIAQEVPGLLRLRYTSPHPRHITPALIRAHRDLDVLPAHVHLPVQSGSDRVLKRMLRRYRRDEVIERARALCAARPGFTLSTDIIVGFPGETEHDFEQTLSLVQEVGFVSAFGFKYSPRPHTPALKLGDDVPDSDKSERLARLFELTEAQGRAHLEGLVGARAQVLFEGPSRSSGRAPAAEGQPSVGPGDAQEIPLRRFVGRSERHEIVHVDVPATYDPVGLLCEVRIEAANNHSLRGSLVSSLPEQARRSPEAWSDGHVGGVAADARTGAPLRLPVLP